ncbi:hypothetical protein [Chryseobacterium sp. G0201]|uniref:hypothetical protein n=1 Tax=Chryseobacterium sp. G0201 TaxID=2487065 RepID=UPI0013DE1F2C|nr:hypothetical protein [Chryseobacterium sp. G0201]
MPVMICENLPRYGVVVVAVETEDTSEVENFGVEISDMFLVHFIVVKQMYKLFLNKKF